MPSVNSRSMPNVWPSSTLTTPSLPTLSIASAITSPISSSPAEIVATRAIWSLPEISLDWRLDVLDDIVDGALDAALERQRVGPGGDVLQTLANDRLGEHGRRRGAVAGHVVGRRGDLADELGALVLEDVLDLDLASDGDAVVGDRRGAELLVEDHVAAAGAERYLDGVGYRVDALLERLAGIHVVLQFLMCHVCSSSPEGFYWTFASTSDSRRTSSSSPSTLISVPPYLL